MKGMLAMAQQHYIKYLWDVKDQSISQIKKQTGASLHPDIWYME
ncbi:hypothetical protein [Brevibacillus antibioticus]|nr:hypothetical protein [Brevibacillus antibioticus]